MKSSSWSVRVFTSLIFFEVVYRQMSCGRWYVGADTLVSIVNVGNVKERE